MTINLDELIKKKTNMKKVETTVTDVTGKRYQVKDINSDDPNRIEINRCVGFVIDTKPDDLSHKIIINNNNDNINIPELFIGSQDAAFNKTDLKLKNIKSILNVGIGITNLFTKENSDINDGFIINYCNVDMLDDIDFNILEKFDICFDFIDSVIVGGGGILVHCNAGISRSSTVLIAYLMSRLKISLSESMGVLKLSRPCCKPNQGFFKQLEIFEKQLIKKY